MPTYPAGPLNPAWPQAAPEVEDYINDLNDREVALNNRVTQNEAAIAALQNFTLNLDNRLSVLEDWRVNEVDPFKAFVELTSPRNPGWVNALIYAVETYEIGRNLAKNDLGIADSRFRPLSSFTGLIRDIDTPPPTNP